MNWQTIIAIAKKDLLEVRQNKAAWIPMIVLPAVFILIIPLAFILIPTQMDISPEVLAVDSDLQLFLEGMPATMTRHLEGLDAMQNVLVLILGMMFAPMFLIFPLMFSTIIASESFAGERERKTMESLLYTPASDAELYLGKVMAALIPAVAISWGSFLLYTVVLNGAAWQIFGRLWFPLPTWYPLIFWIVPGLAVLGISTTVLISTRVQTFIAAYQASASLVIVVVAIFAGQLTGVVYLTVGVGLLVGLLVWLIAAALTYVSIRNFKRQTLLLGKN